MSSVCGGVGKGGGVLFYFYLYREEINYMIGQVGALSRFGGGGKKDREKKKRDVGGGGGGLTWNSRVRMRRFCR